MLEPIAIGSEKYQRVVEFLARNLDHLIHQGGMGGALDFPEFDMMPFDYLEFAEQELAHSSAASRINCVGHLKRAVECELDTLVRILGVAKEVSSFPKKLDFTSACGVISPRSLAKLNKIRNRMEHEYAVPDIDELEVYFDLASGFVHTVEGYIFMMYANKSMEYSNNAHPSIEFTAHLHTSPPRVEFVLQEDDAEATVSFAPSELPVYCEGLKIYFLLCRAIALLSDAYVLAKLQGKPLLTPGSGRV